MSAALAVTRHELELVALARALFTRAPADELRGLLELERPQLQSLTPAGARALEDALAKGAALFLARSGGWRRRGGQRLWERWPAPELRFGVPSFRLLAWLLRLGPRGDAQPPPLPAIAQGTGDELLLLAALAATRGTPWHPVLAAQPAVRASGLCALGFAFTLGRVAPLERVPALDLRPGSWHRLALDGLGELLADAWVQAEQEKARESSPARLRAGGEAQERVLEVLLAASADHSTRGACDFLFEVARLLVRRPLPPREYGLSLAPTASLRERSLARAASGALLRALAQLHERRLALLLLRFVDDGYEEARAQVDAWDGLGPGANEWLELAERYRALEVVRA